VIDISDEKQVIHKRSSHLLLPTIFINDEKEQQIEVPRRGKTGPNGTGKCLSNIEKNIAEEKASHPC
jgi:hypothetical protein